MISTISCELNPAIHFIDAIKNTFPMGSMTGAPKIKAMELIDAYEKSKRGAFSGSLVVLVQWEILISMLLSAAFYTMQPNIIYHFKLAGR
jgi:anthranilate/para-aminobenzoate synthase component I